MVACGRQKACIPFECLRSRFLRLIQGSDLEIYRRSEPQQSCRAYSKHRKPCSLTLILLNLFPTERRAPFVEPRLKLGDPFEGCLLVGKKEPSDVLPKRGSAFLTSDEAFQRV